LSCVNASLAIDMLALVTEGIYRGHLRLSYKGVKHGGSNPRPFAAANNLCRLRAASRPDDIPGPEAAFLFPGTLMFDLRDEPLRLGNAAWVPVSAFARAAGITRQSGWVAARMGRVRSRLIGRDLWVELSDAATFARAHGRDLPPAWAGHLGASADGD
jgi:hypothetical protein